VQVHDRPVERAGAGQRVAVALPGIERAELRRGDALVEPDAYPVSYRLDVRLETLPGVDLPERMRVHVHHGTAEHYARLVRIGEQYAQLRLDSPAVAARGDRVVLRDRTTIAGAVVLDPAPPRRAVPEFLALLERGDPESIVLGALAASPEPLTRNDLTRRALLAPDLLDRGLSAAVRVGDWYLTEQRHAELSARVAATLAERAAGSPLDPGIPLAELLPRRPWAAALVSSLPLERRGAKAYAPGASAQLGDRAAAAEQLEAQLAESGFTPVRPDDRELAGYLEAAGRLVRLGDGLVLGSAAYDEARRLLVEECERQGQITLARFRDLVGAGRRAAQLLLERFDADGLTRRAGEARVLRKRGRGAAP
jgi:selenocysteine-specific elongation factor